MLGLFIIAFFLQIHLKQLIHLTGKQLITHRNLSSSQPSGRFRGFKVSMETPFWIDFNLVGLNTLIEQSDRDNRALGSKCTSYRSFIRNNCNVWEGREEYKSWWPIFLVFNSVWTGVFVKLKLKPLLKNPGSATATLAECPIRVLRLLFHIWRALDHLVSIALYSTIWNKL